MVELCELKLMNKEMDYWPADIDQHVAQLDFDNSSSMMIEQSLFSSSTADDVDVTDPNQDEEDEENEQVDEENRQDEEEVEEEEEEEEEEVRLRIEELTNAAVAVGGSIVISTDSLDMDLIRDCSGSAKNRNEYKLIFEDSGQWTTTSGIGASMTTNSNGSPPTRRVASHRNQSAQQPQLRSNNLSTINGRMLDRHFGLRLLEQLNNETWTEAIVEASEDEKQKLIDNLLNNVASATTNLNTEERSPMTTWGRIQNVEPYDGKVYSMQNVYRQQNDNMTADTSSSDAEVAAAPRRPFSSDDVLLLPGVAQPITQLSKQQQQQQRRCLSNNSDSRSSKNSANSSRTSLVANFVEQYQPKQQWTHNNQNRRTLDYEYNETYLGDGRYMDLNENEIGFVPESTAAIQRSSASNSSGEQQNSNSRQQQSTISEQQPSSACRGSSSEYRHQAASVSGVGNYYAKTAIGGSRSSGNMRHNAVYDQKKKAFGAVTQMELPPSNTAPDLKFLSLTYKTPSFCRSEISLDEMLRRARNGSFLFTENLMGDDKFAALLSDGCSGGTPALTQEQLSLLNHNIHPDSGLGSSSSSGPAHIEDWSSLAFLLPKHVVDACSFFKTNSSLLTGSNASQNSLNNIERKMSNAAQCVREPAETTENFDAATCRTCFSIRRRRLHPPPWAHRASAINASTKTPLCDCVSCCCCLAVAQPQSHTTMSEIAVTSQREKPMFSQYSNNRLTVSATGMSTIAGRIPRLSAAELSVVGLPLYNSKRALVERVVEGVAEIARGASAVVLYSALSRLLADGLLDGCRPWGVIVAVTRPGPATNKIFTLVKTLEASEKPENSRIDHFFKGLLSLHSLEGWLSYMVLKENVLTQLYADTAFLPRANTAYRSLFWRLIESIELLSVLSQCSQHKNQQKRSSKLDRVTPSNDREWGGASRLPSDSRIPKSSSIPEKLTTDSPMALNATDGMPKAWKNARNETTVYTDAIMTPSTSAPISFVDAIEKVACATIPRTSNARRAHQHRRGVSRIPIALSHAHNEHSMTQCAATPHLFNSPNFSMLRTRSLHSRPARSITPMLMARARERIAESDAQIGALRLLPLDKGEQVRVLSVRGDLSRCCRTHLRFGALLNGIVPTHKLNLC